MTNKASRVLILRLASLALLAMGVLIFFLWYQFFFATLLFGISAGLSLAADKQEKSNAS